MTLVDRAGLEPKRVQIHFLEGQELPADWSSNLPGLSVTDHEIKLTLKVGLGEALLEDGWLLPTLQLLHGSVFETNLAGQVHADCRIVNVS